MKYQNKSIEQIIQETNELQAKYDDLKYNYDNLFNEKQKETYILEILIRASEDFIQFSKEKPDYKKILRIILTISGAKYASFNLFDDDGLEFTTVEISGLNENLEKGLEMLGFQIRNKHWNHDPIRAEKLKRSSISYFEKLSELVGNSIPKNLINLIEKTFKIGPAYIVKIAKENKVLGDITLLFSEGETLQNHKFVELYAQLVGMFLDRYKIISNLRMSQAKSSAILNTLPDMMFIQNYDGVYTDLYIPDTAKSYIPKKVFVGQKMQNVLPKDIANKFLTVFENAIQSGQMQLMEYSLMMSDRIHFFEARTIHYSTNQVLSIIRDITTQKDNEKKLKLSENSYRGVLNQVSELIYIQDENGLIIDVNETAEKKYGYPHHFFIGKNLEFLSAPGMNDFSQISNLIQNALSGAPQRFEFWAITKNGIIFPKEVILSSGTYFDKKVIIAVARDITERKHAEEKLRESEELYRSIIKGSPDVIAITNLEGCILMVSLTALTLFGFDTEEDFLGKPITDFIVFGFEWEEEFMNCRLADSSVSQQNEQNQYYSMLIQERIFTGNNEYRAMRADGSLFYIEMNAEFIRDVDGQPIEMLLIIRDITDRKRSEAIQKEALERLQKIASRVPGLVYQYILRPDGSSCFPFASDAILDIYRVTPDEVRYDASKVFEILHPEDYQGVVDSINASAIDVSPWQYEYRVKYKDDTIRSLYGNAVPQKQDDGSVLWHGFITDITERKMDELQILEINKELFQLNADKDRFMSILAHDLKSPFNSLLGFLELLTQNIHNYDLDKIEKQINIVNNSAKNTYKLLEDLLMWVRSQSGKLPYEPVMINFFNVCEEVIDILLPIANSKNIKLNHFAAEEINFMADADMLKTVLRNLITNAIKFTHSGGKVDIYAEWIENRINITVSDNGVGIEPDVIHKLFDISQKITTNGTANEPGTGLGLLLCKEFVEKHGGKIKVDSELGKGSVFVFEIPVS